MKIGIDISQIVFERTGVANYVRNLVENLVKIDKENEYVLFFSSLRRKLPSFFINELTNSRVKIREFKFPPTLLDFLWNRLHIFPIEWFIGGVDVFLSSDWVQPPTVKAKKVTVIHDLIALKYPEETHPRTEFRLKNLIISPNIVEIQKRRLKWVKKECDLIICDSEATKKDAMEILGIEEGKLRVVYRGGT